MRVALIAPIPPFRGGIAKYCYSLAGELEKRHELLLLSYRRQYPALLYGKKSQTDPEVDRGAIAGEFSSLSFDLDSANPLSWIASVRRILEFRTELLILPWWVAYWTPLYLYLLWSLKRKGVRVLLLCINVYEHEGSRLKKFLTELVLRRAECMVVHSEQELRQVAAINPKARVAEHLLPLFSYPAAPEPKRGEGYQLLFFGFVRPYKGLDVLLRGMALLKESGVRLTVAGEFWNDKESYTRLIEELGIAEMVSVVDGYIPESAMAGYFSAADLVVLPYKRSMTSGIVATAYGFGKPVLATRVGGFHEIISEGYTGRLVAPDDAEAFAEGIRWFLKNREIDFAGNISEFTSRTMSWRSLTELIERLGEGKAD